MEISENPHYREFKTELKICRIGGLFLALYQDKSVINAIIRQLQKDLPDYFIFSLAMTAQKVGFPTFFEQTFQQAGDQSNIFHVTGIETLTTELQADFIKYLQYTRERFKAEPYSLVFWITPQFEKQLFFAAPDFHHWTSGTYDFSQIPVSVSLPEKPDYLENIAAYLENVIRQYEHWQEVKDREEQDFLIEVMGRANLNEYYVPTYGIDEYKNSFLLDDLFKAFLLDCKQNFLTLLGDSGTGKSTFSLYYYIHLARQYLQDKNARIPIFISLKDYRGKLNIETFMVREFYEKFRIEISFQIFQNLALQGKFVFFVDGFDEMASLANLELTVKNFRELTKLSFENILFMTNCCEKRQTANKVFLTSRTHYFFSEMQEKEILKADYTILYRNYATKSNYAITRIRLKQFNDEQIEDYILKNTNNRQLTDDILETIKNTYNLQDLSTRPLLLEMIVRAIRSLTHKSEVNAYVLYQAYTDQWIDRDDWRSLMKPEGKRAFMWDLALKMFRKGGAFTLHYSELNPPEKEHLKENFRVKGEDYYQYETLTCSFLNRDKAGNYKFIHKSFMEYFIAEHFFNTIKRKEKRTIRSYQFNRETEIFLQLAIVLEKSNLKNLDLSGLHLNGIDLRKANLGGTNLKEAKLKEANLEGANLKEANFEGADLKEANIVDADLRGANLREAKLKRADLIGADLKEANIVGAYLRGAKLKGASLIRADFADFRGANLKGANLKGADLRGANLKGANLKGANLKGANLKGANFRGANLREVYFK